MNVGSLFSGYGGLDLAVSAMFDAPVVWHSEIEPAACKVLEHRFPGVPNLGDITKVDWSSAEPVEVLTGGFPCQDVSSAGRRLGIRPGTRSGLWEHMAYAIGSLRPSLVVIENVRGLLSADAHCDLEPCPWCLGDDEGRPLRALGAVLGDLAELGYDARWHGIRAADVGAPHGRFRVFIGAWPVADAGHERAGWTAGSGEAARGWARGDLAGRGNAPAADADGEGPQGYGRLHPASREVQAAAHDRDAAADADGDGLEVVGQGPESHPRDHADRRSEIGWGEYESAIRRWEYLTGRVAPAPTATGSRGGQQLSPLFVEWMMGLPEGWVTAVPDVSRNEMLKLLGNGVVPQQAMAALRVLLADLTEVAA